MQYRDLLGKKIGLIGNEKICHDIQFFFSELSYEEVIFVDEQYNIEEVLLKINKSEVIIIGQEGDLSDVNNSLKNTAIISLTDLFNIVDELETFFIDKMHHGKTIFVYGDEKKIEGMISSNPHLKIDYILVDSEKDEKIDSLFEKVSVEKITYISDKFIIIADEVSSLLKNKFVELGLSFGDEFHFFNSRVPKNYTSYYLKKTMMDEPLYTLPCDYTTKALSIKKRGNIMACCSSVSLVMGNCLYTSIEEVLRGIQAQLICLSVNNRTYSFCGNLCFMYREKEYKLDNREYIKNNQRVDCKLKIIEDFNVQLGYDRSCNLACPSCRSQRIIIPEDSTEHVEMIHEEVKRLCKKNPRNIRIGNGELFFSKYYKDIIFNHYNNNKIALITNGMLFTPENWRYLEKKYSDISLEVSIDAINPDTYKKLRGGDLYRLQKNMEFASELRKKGKLKRFSISFVIQVSNYKEMVGFVEYGKRINADFIHFMKMNNFGHISDKEFVEMDVYDVRNKWHKEFVEILHNPIFLENCVHVDNIRNFITE